MALADGLAPRSASTTGTHHAGPCVYSAPRTCEPTWARLNRKYLLLFGRQPATDDPAGWTLSGRFPPTAKDEPAYTAWETFYADRTEWVTLQGMTSAIDANEAMSMLPNPEGNDEGEDRVRPQGRGGGAVRVRSRRGRSILERNQGRVLRGKVIYWGSESVRPDAARCWGWGRRRADNRINGPNLSWVELYVPDAAHAVRTGRPSNLVGSAVI